MEHVIYIYVLLLEGGRYYVGKSRWPDWRLWQHTHGKGAQWTRLHPTVKRVYRYPFYVVTEYDEDRLEDRVTIETMERYGWQNVRGGSWCEVSDGDTLKSLHRGGYFRDVKAAETVLAPLEVTRYVLRLADRKYYVGCTRDLNRTLRTYVRGKGPRWLQEHPYARVVKSHALTCPGGAVDNRRDLDPVVIEYFRKYGWENVRGGTFSQADPDRHRRSLEKYGIGPYFFQ